MDVTKHKAFIGTSKNDLWVVRLYDGFDYTWYDSCPPCSAEDALAVWDEQTENGTKSTTYRDIDYYAIYPANTVMAHNANNK